MTMNTKTMVPSMPMLREVQCEDLPEETAYPSGPLAARFLRDRMIDQITWMRMKMKLPLETVWMSGLVLMNSA